MNTCMTGSLSEFLCCATAAATATAVCAVYECIHTVGRLTDVSTVDFRTLCVKYFTEHQASPHSSQRRARPLRMCGVELPGFGLDRLDGDRCYMPCLCTLVNPGSTTDISSRTNSVAARKRHRGERGCQTTGVNGVSISGWRITVTASETAVVTCLAVHAVELPSRGPLENECINVAVP